MPGTMLRRKGLVSVSKLLKCAILGGVAGAGVATYMAYQEDDSMDELATKAAQTAGAGAVLGALLGLVLDRRAHKRAEKAAFLASYASMKKSELKKLKKAGKKAAKKAHKEYRPVVDHALASATAAAEAAKPVVENWAHQAGPAALDAADKARGLAGELPDRAAGAFQTGVEAAKPYAREAAERVEELRPHAKRAAMKAAKRAHKQAEIARKAAVKAAERTQPTMKSARGWASDLRAQAVEARANGGRRPVIVKLG